MHVPRLYRFAKESMAAQNHAYSDFRHIVWKMDKDMTDINFRLHMVGQLDEYQRMARITYKNFFMSLDGDVNKMGFVDIPLLSGQIETLSKELMRIEREIVCSDQNILILPVKDAINELNCIQCHPFFDINESGAIFKPTDYFCYCINELIKECEPFGIKMHSMFYIIAKNYPEEYMLPLYWKLNNQAEEKAND